jgi:tetratricopeptide (TPR) repeat protein
MISRRPSIAAAASSLACIALAAAQPLAAAQSVPVGKPVSVEAVETVDMRTGPAAMSRRDALLQALAPGVRINPSEVSVDEAQRAVSAHPRDADAWHQLGESLEVAGRLDEAVDAYDRATKLPPRVIGRAFLYRDLASAREQAGDLAGALEAARVSIRTWPLSRDGLFCTQSEVVQLARLLVRMGDLGGVADLYLPLADALPDNEYCAPIAAAMRRALAE